MVTIFKYALVPMDYQTVQMPEGAQLLTVQEQHGVPTLWAIVDTSQPFYRQGIHCVGTGNPMPTGVRLDKYIATIQTYDGFVWHFFRGGH